MTRPILTTLTSLLVVVCALVGQPSSVVHADPGDLSGSLPGTGGIGLIVWGGGDLELLAATTATRGCVLRAAWATTADADARFVGHIRGAPAIVNARFHAAYPAGIPANTALLVVCDVVRAPVPPIDHDGQRADGSDAGPSGNQVLARATSTVNGATYETICTRTNDAAPSSSVGVAQRTSSHNGVVSVFVTLRTNETDYVVVAAGVKNEGALAALNAVLVNVVCTVTP